MKKIIIPFFCAVLFSTSVAAQQKTTAAKTEAVKSKLTPKEVIDNYLKALGGRDKLEAIKTTVIENTVTVQGMEIAMTTKKMGNKFKSVQSVMGQQMTQVFDGEKGTFDQMGQKMDIPADKIADLKKSKTVDALGYDPASFQSVNVEKIDGKDYNVLTSDKGKYFFDATTGLLYKSESKEGTAIVKDYMTVDGLKFPGEVDAEGNGQKVVIKTTKIVLNSGVTDADFKL
ncbi:hypothetical protein ACNFU2_09950 [Chryseobacterium sp. PTM-20240506]|uniref:hypothetical protein n=2 Tax=Chryseobacterium TaxID=59732 RepID=UPI001557D44E|nr:MULTISPECIES: hypothetical protein [unclassified Chryseobacterium]MDQ1805474.1 hypothetical protein [Chryseobacterium sp. CKR4-1]WBV58628.1 hypothetical protein PFY10_09230 [Chryseobacterium daecheongense]